MPTIGETKTRFGRSYIYLNPPINGNTSGQGTWRLTSEDNASGTTEVSDLVFEATVASDEPTVAANQLLYLDSSGRARLADASSITTAKVVGISTGASSANNLVSYVTTVSTTINNVNTVVDNVTTGVLTPGAYYYLSDTNPGNLTTTPDTTTAGNVVIQVGMAAEYNKLIVEIQQPVVI